MSAFAVVTAVLAVGLKVWLVASAPSPDHLAGHRGITGDTEVATNGVLGTPGGPVSVAYVKRPHEFETTYGAAIDPNRTFPVTGGVVWALNKWVPKGRDVIDLSYLALDRPVAGTAGLKRWLADLIRDADESAYGAVATDTTTVDGRTAYTQEFISREGWWRYYVRVLDAGHVARFGCRAISPTNTAFKERCKQVASTMKFGGPRK